MPLRVSIVAQARSVGPCGMLLLSLGFLLHTHLAFAQEQRFTFNIPSQALEAALETYGSVTGRDALYNSSLTIGRRSTAVQGQLPPDTALMILLEGTGLSARYEKGGSYVLLASPPAADPTPPLAVGQYYARLQGALQAVLCADSEARPGAYRVAVRFWIGSAGDIVRYERLSSAGEPTVDEGVDRNLRNLRIGAPPPTGLAQPITMLIMPQAIGTTMGCDARRTRTAQ